MLRGRNPASPTLSWFPTGRAVWYHRTHEHRTVRNKRIRYTPGFPTGAQTSTSGEQRRDTLVYPLVDQPALERVRLPGGHAPRGAGI